MIFTLVVVAQHKGEWTMLSNKKRVQMCYSLLSAMLPDSVADDFGFSAKTNERIYLAYTNQVPRPEVQTCIYFSIKDEAYKQARSDPHHYDSNDIEVLEQMRQIKLTVDIYSKVVPIGNANDVARWLNTMLISDQYEEWRRAGNWPAVIERIDIMPDLTYLLESNVWNNRAQLVIYLNYRDVVSTSKLYMTRKPDSIEDLPNSVDYVAILKD